MRIYHIVLSLILLIALFVPQAEANCMQIAQDFKCSYKHMQCHNNDDGECECDDGTMCKWKGQQPVNDNCPCGGKSKGPRRKKRRVGGM